MKEAYCKIDHFSINNDDLLFKKGKIYPVELTNDKQFDIVVRKPEVNSGGAVGCMFVYKVFYQYFYDIQELRKIKLNKLNEKVLESL